MKVHITSGVLDALNTGMPHDLALVRRARAVLEAAGLEVEIHETERAEIDRLHRMADDLHREADNMERWLQTGDDDAVQEVC